MENYLNTISGNILNYRKMKGWTQEQLSDMLGLTFQSVSKWENGQSMPDILLLPKLAELFEITIDQLFGKVNKKENIVDEKNPEYFKDDGILHACVFKGNKLLTETRDLEDFYFHLEGQLLNVDVLCNLTMENANVEGDISCEGDLMGNFHVEGDFNCGGDLKGTLDLKGDFNCEGDINGNINAFGDLNCEGNITGDIVIKGDLNCEGKINGEIQYKEDFENKIRNYDLKNKHKLLIDPHNNRGLTVGTEVTENKGAFDEPIMHVGFTRCIYLGIGSVSQSRLDFDFTSSDPSIATVSQYGTVTALKEGVVEIKSVSKYNQSLGKIIITVLP